MENNFATSAAAEAPPEPVTPVALSDARYDLILLDPSKVRLFRTGGTTVRMALDDPQVGEERSYLKVSVARAFPLSDPEHYIGLRDGADKDIGMLRSLEGLDAESRAIAEEELKRRYFLPRITRVREVTEEFGMTTWDVETDKGDRTFIVHNLKESVNELTPTRVLITDMEGNRYEFPDIRKLDEKSFGILQRVL
uniref:DUF1854 domain-containing protein n=1 Tax=uncultured Armatimonadetes bacterium TaxID=157466 RepID=A0A6J4JUC6_9BACT|nr:hypothetical protein AVDCRST_MAG63-4094 [uncultured Armatimonadetes bacterium]